MLLVFEHLPAEHLALPARRATTRERRGASLASPIATRVRAMLAGSLITASSLMRPRKTPRLHTVRYAGARIVHERDGG